MAESQARPYGARQAIGLLAGLAALGLVLAAPPPAGLSVEGWRVAGVALLMACWWIGESLPMPVTALVPLILFPLLGVAPIKSAAHPYANPLIFLFAGGFMIAMAMQRWGLHRRLALNILNRVGEKPVMIIAGFMTATAFLSMWVSNTATTMMMLPIAMSIVELMAAHDKSGAAAPATFAVALMLGTAYAASIGGLGTLIGTPPNALLAGFLLETYGFEIGFGRWMLIGLPVVLILLPLTWYLLTHLVYRIGPGEVTGARDLVAAELRGLGPMSAGERWVATVASFTALAWIVRPLISREFPELHLTDAGIALISALILFAIPLNRRGGDFVLDWAWAVKIPWGILLLLGGGLSLAASIKQSGLAGWIVTAIGGLSGFHILICIAVVTAIIVFLTELTSNTATTAAFLPVVAALALSLSENPLLLAVPVVLGASCAFMMPVATPPNAIVFGSGRVSLPEMARAGLALNLVAIAVISGLAYWLLILVFDVETASVPAWAGG